MIKYNDERWNVLGLRQRYEVLRTSNLSELHIERHYQNDDGTIKRWYGFPLAIPLKALQQEGTAKEIQIFEELLIKKLLKTTKDSSGIGVEKEHNTFLPVDNIK